MKYRSIRGRDVKGRVEAGTARSVYVSEKEVDGRDDKNQIEGRRFSPESTG